MDEDEVEAKTQESTSTGLNELTTASINRLRLIHDAVKDLDPALKERAVALLFEREFGTGGTQPRASGLGPSGASDRVGEEPERPAFDSFVEKWSPADQSEWALLASYYLTKVGGQDRVMGQEVNSTLKHHGLRVKNITGAIGRLMKSEPALMLQVRKDGTTRQARKSYRVTTSGVTFVERKLNGGVEVRT